MLHVFKAVEVRERRRCLMINAVALANSSCLTMIVKLSEVIIRRKRDEKAVPVTKARSYRMM